MDWLLMGGHGSFVWGSYALGLGVLIWLSLIHISEPTRPY